MMPSCLVLVKNEQYWLPYVLKQTEGYFDSYVIYDIGSTDRTRDIINWWTARMEGKAHLFVRYLPDCPPGVQGAFRNSMIVEGQRDIYFILDGDELYKPEEFERIHNAASYLKGQHEYFLGDAKKRYGVVRRVEVTDDLRMQYVERRGHHRLYTRDAFWHGDHPGEAAVYKQDDKSEIWFNDITCWHMHNTLRSPKEADATRRFARKGRKTYHPGDKKKELDLLHELPVLRHPIESFHVTPALAKLQDEYRQN